MSNAVCNSLGSWIVSLSVIWEYNMRSSHQGYSKFGPWSRIRNGSQWTTEDRQSVVTKLKSRVHRPRKSLEILHCGPQNKKFEYPWFTPTIVLLSSQETKVNYLFLDKGFELLVFISIIPRDGPKTFWVETETKTETWAPETETRPRRLPNWPRRDPRVSETRPKRDLFLVETISRHMAYICMVYALHTVSQKKNPLD